MMDEYHSSPASIRVTNLASQVPTSVFKRLRDHILTEDLYIYMTDQMRIPISVGMWGGSVGVDKPSSVEEVGDA